MGSCFPYTFQCLMRHIITHYISYFVVIVLYICKVKSSETGNCKADYLMNFLCQYFLISWEVLGNRSISLMCTRKEQLVVMLIIMYSLTCHTVVTHPSYYTSIKPIQRIGPMQNL